MPERESNYIPPEAESVIFDHGENNQRVEQNSTPEQLKNNLLRRINGFFAKYPKLTNVALGFTFALELKFGTEVFLRSQMNTPNIATRSHEVSVTAENSKVADELISELGPYEIEQILKTESVKNQEERERVSGLPRNMQINGFEKFDISNETVEAVVNQTMPKGFGRNISQISYGDYNASMPLQYGVRLMQKTGEAAHASKFDKSIQVTKGAKGADKKWIVNQLLPHEFFHLQDWNSNSLLTADERIDLLKKIVDRVKSSDRYKSDYVEGIKNADKKKELLTKAAEYFADIGAAFLSPRYLMLPKADRELVQDLIKKIDPNFDRVQALKQRGKLVAEKKPGLFTDTLEELKISRTKDIEQMIRGFQGTLREKIKLDQPDISDENLDKLVNRWMEHERKAAILGAEQDFKEKTKENKKILKADEERASKQ